MTARFTVLASGSSGNVALLEHNGFGLLIDCGLHPRFLTARLQSVGASWNRVSAVVLTHTHTDHWKDGTLADLNARKIPLYAHPKHFDFMDARSANVDHLNRNGLAREYTDAPFELTPGLICRPVRVSHDSVPTYAFRVEAHDGGTGPSWVVGYASDLGCGSSELIEAFAGADVLALEYNHDEMMERASPRPKFLVDRVLGDMGHLSNTQAAELTATIAGRSGEGFPAALIQLHLSRDCNTPELAAVAGREALVGLNPATEVITAKQDFAVKSIPLARRPNAANRAVARVKPQKRRVVQPSLPGFDEPLW